MLTLLITELYIIAAGTLIFVIFKLGRAHRRYRYISRQPNTPDSDLPSVSICLPARNETNSMTECLESILASDYPKMEVIVFDDNSSDNTSHLIKAFAHAGVRFVKGNELPSDWLGKNFALETLLGEASGRYVMMMDVDTRIDPQTVRKMTEEMIAHDTKMVSIIPQRYDTFRASAWLSTLRYFWELVLDSKSSPGSSSASWLVERRVLKDELGGFGIWRDEVQPESYIAKEFARTNEYRLIMSTSELGVSYAKKWSSQIETGRRLLLPKFNNSLLSMMIGVGLLAAVVVPQIIVIISIVEGAWLLLYAELALGLVATLIFASYCHLTWRNRWWIAFFVAPYVAWQELFLLMSSAVGYYRGTITWKGRVVVRPTRKNLNSSD